MARSLNDNLDKKLICLKEIVNYFPSIKKLSKFLTKFDRIYNENYRVAPQKEDNASPLLSSERNPQYELLRANFTKQMRSNKMLMKICVDVSLTFA